MRRSSDFIEIYFINTGMHVQMIQQIPLAGELFSQKVQTSFDCAYLEKDDALLYTT